MCLILFGWKIHSKHDLILVANRDEFYNRPTQSAHEWSEYPGIIGGLDKTAGGTWMGVSKTGRFAALTNYRDPANIDPNAPSRGNLTKEFLIDNISPQDYLSQLQTRNDPYNGFNLLIGDKESLCYYNNVNHKIESLEPGVYGLSNAYLNDSWPKVDNGRHQLKSLIERQEITSNQLFDLIVNQDKAPDEKLPDTGVPLEWERALSAMFITAEEYGSRCSTVILKSGTKTRFTEWTHAHVGQKKDQVEIIL